MALFLKHMRDIWCGETLTLAIVCALLVSRFAVWGGWLCAI